MFEGNSIIIEIYHQADNSKVEFFTTYVISGSLIMSLIIMMGTMSYLAFAQYTKSLILLNMPSGTASFVIQLAYIFALIMSSGL